MPARALFLALIAVALPAAAQQAPHQTCVDVKVGTTQSYDCLNQALGAVAAQSPHFTAAADAPYSATSPPNATGQFTESATRNRLGANFGKSVTPQRPPTAAPGPAFGPH